MCITSCLSAVPSDCRTLDIPASSIVAARETFYRICGNAERTDLVDDVLNQLDFHPLSITLLATVAHQNRWVEALLSQNFVFVLNIATLPLSTGVLWTNSLRQPRVVRDCCVVLFLHCGYRCSEGRYVTAINITMRS
jgi:hypothetical protein